MSNICSLIYFNLRVNLCKVKVNETSKRDVKYYGLINTCYMIVEDLKQQFHIYNGVVQHYLHSLCDALFVH